MQTRLNGLAWTADVSDTKWREVRYEVHVHGVTMNPNSREVMWYSRCLGAFGREADRDTYFNAWTDDELQQAIKYADILANLDLDQKGREKASSGLERLRSTTQRRAKIFDS